MGSRCVWPNNHELKNVEESFRGMKAAPSAILASMDSNDFYGKMGIWLYNHTDHIAMDLKYPEINNLEQQKQKTGR